MRERVADGPVEEAEPAAPDGPPAIRLGATAALTPRALLGLQRAAGNRAAAALVARQPAATAAGALATGSTGP